MTAQLPSSEIKYLYVALENLPSLEINYLYSRQKKQSLSEFKRYHSSTATAKLSLSKVTVVTALQNKNSFLGAALRKQKQFLLQIQLVIRSTPKLWSASKFKTSYRTTRAVTPKTHHTPQDEFRSRLSPKHALQGRHNAQSGFGEDLVEIIP